MVCLVESLVPPRMILVWIHRFVVTSARTFPAVMYVCRCKPSFRLVSGLLPAVSGALPTDEDVYALCKRNRSYKASMAASAALKGLFDPAPTLQKPCFL